MLGKWAEWSLLFVALTVPVGLFYHWLGEVRPPPETSVVPTRALLSTVKDAAKPVSRPAAPKPSPTPPALPDSPVPSSPGTGQVSLAARQPEAHRLLYSPATGRDPMVSDLELRMALASKPKSETKKPPRKRRRRAVPAWKKVRAGLEVQGIVELDGKRTAIVNGERVEIGGTVFGAEVVAIEADTVSFRYKRRGFSKKMR